VWDLRRLISLSSSDKLAAKIIEDVLTGVDHSSESRGLGGYALRRKGIHHNPSGVNIDGQ